MMKNKIRLLCLLSTALLTAACTPSTKETEKHTAHETEKPSVKEVEKPAAKKSETHTAKETAKRTDPASDCSNLHQAGNIDGIIRQIADNIDSTCLFERSPDELAAAWGIIGGSNKLEKLLFPNISEDDPMRHEKLSEGVNQLMSGQRNQTNRL